MKYIPREEWSVEYLKYWRSGKNWCCAIPRDDIATRNGLSWKTHGLVGQGKSRKAACEDWEKWKRVSDFVSDIY